MAISALQAQEELYVDSKCKTCRYYHDYDDVRCMICDDENDMYEAQEQHNFSQKNDSFSQGLVNDLISRQALIAELGISQDCSVCEQCDTPLCGWKPDIVDVCTAICDAPTIKPERKKGKWIIYVISAVDGEDCKCSECGKRGVPYWDFCPECGADMRGGKDG